MKTWLITGTSSGIGRCLAEEALSRGDAVVATARDPQTVRDLERQYPGRALALRLDVTKPEEVASAIGETKKAFGRIDVLVNNAGRAMLGTLEDSSEDSARELFETNFFGMLSVIRQALPVFRAQKSGRIVNISSLAGRSVFPTMGIYAATKFAVEGMSEALAKEMQLFGVRVIIVEPGAFATDLGKNATVVKIGTPYAALEENIAHIMKEAKFSEPRSAARTIIEAVDAADPPLRLAVGADAFAFIRQKLLADLAELESWENISKQASENLTAG
jgi:NADP-dependent 3-hydroxy acid dehydrogenase YdfG